MSTAYHAKYFACELNRIGGAGVGRLSRSLFDACVDLNPHQIEAALFAFRSPVSKGVLLADEVGLGKTIEAGLVLCQFWAERRRRLLVICPASIRKQWELELAEKFNLPAAGQAVRFGMIGSDLRFPQHLSQDANCVKEVVQRIRGLTGSEVGGSLEIQADVQSGILDNAVRIITENWPVLKLKTHGFEGQ